MNLALYERNATLYSAWKRRGADRCLRWVPAENGFVPNGAIAVGYYGGRGGELMYVGRMTLPNNDTMPGTIIPGRRACYAAWRGAELEAVDYEVLINTQPDKCHLHWANMPPSPRLGEEQQPPPLPIEAVKGGFDAANSQLIYIARTRPPNALGTHVGQVRGDQTSTAVLSYNGAEYRTDNFRILCRKFVHPSNINDYEDNSNNIFFANNNNNRPFTAFL